MRKVNPADTRTFFSDQIDGISAYIDRVAEALVGTPKEKSDISHLCESAFLDAIVEFESFIFEIFLAYMNKDFQQYQADLAGRISSLIQKECGVWAQNRTKYSPVSNLAVDKIADILDPDSKILTFSDSAKMIKTAKKWITPKLNSGIVRLPKPDLLLVDTARSIRNYIAHGSEKAYKEMNAKLLVIDKGPPNGNLGRTVNKVDNVGSFLKTYVNGKRRIELYLQRMKSIANRM